MHGSRHLASPGPSDCETDSPPLKSHSHTASPAPAASFKRPYQNCPDRISSRSSHRCRGSPDKGPIVCEDLLDEGPLQRRLLRHDREWAQATHQKSKTTPTDGTMV